MRFTMTPPLSNITNNVHVASSTPAREATEQLNHNMTMAVLPVTIFIGLECVVGLVGNVLILVVYSLRYERTNFRCFVLSMAVVDLTSCLTTLPGEMFSQMNWYTYEHAWICKVKSYFNVLTAWASACILFGLAFDRYRKICHPLGWQLRQRVALRLCVASVLVGVVIASPITVLWGKQDYMYVAGDLKLNVSICEKSGQYADEVYPFVYIACVYILPVSLMMLVVCTLNVLTARTLFCGMGYLNSDLQSHPSVSTLHSVISTISFGHIFSHKRSEQSRSISISRTNIDIVFETDEHREDTPDGQQTDQDFSDIAQNSGGTETNLTPIPPPKDSNNNKNNIDNISNNNNNNNNTTNKNHNNDNDRNNRINNNNNSYNSSENSHPSFSLSLSSRSDTESIDNVKCQAAISKISCEIKEYRRKRKTVIMLVLTSVFVVTMLMYVIMVSLVADSEGTLKSLSNSEKAVFFFFWRMYFINCIVNPLLYGFVDPRFRSGLVKLFKRSGPRNT